VTDSSTRRDPFAASADAASYIPRRATEEVLASLTSYLRVGATQVALRGPDGIGRTLLLRVMAARLTGAMRVVEVPYPALPPDEIAGWILSLMGLAASQEPERTLVQRARQLRDEGSGLAILLDDAGSTPLPTLRRLSRIAREARPALHLVLVVPEDERGDEIVAAIGPDVEVVEFRELMDEDETRAYVDGRLMRAGATGRVRRLFAEEAAAEIHHESGGLAAEVNRSARRWWAKLAGSAAERAPASAPPPASTGLGSALLADRAPIDLENPPGVLPTHTFSEAPTEILPVVAEQAVPDLPLRASTPVPSPRTDEEVTLSLPAEEPVAEPPESELNAVTRREPVPLPRRAPRPRKAVRARSWRGRNAALGAVLAVALALAFALGRVSSDWPDSQIPEMSSLWSGVRDRLAALRGPAPREEPSVPALPATPPARETAEAAAAPGPSVRPPVVTLVPSPAPEPEPEAVAKVEAETTAPEAAASAEVAAVEEPVETAPAEPVPEPSRAESEEPVPAVATAPPAARTAPPEASSGSAGASEAVPAPHARGGGPPIAVSINAIPWASIEVDGEGVGVTPLADIPLSQGEHEFRAIFGDGREVVRRERIDDLNRRILFR